MLKEAFETSLLHLSRAEFTRMEILGYDLNETIFEDPEKIKSIDAFIYRFVKLQDYMGEKVFRNLLRAIGEYKENMSFLDVLDRLEKLELIKSADEWIELREIRNTLTHDYPNNRGETLQGIREALKRLESKKDVLSEMRLYSQKRGFLN